MSAFSTAHTCIFTSISSSKRRTYYDNSSSSSAGKKSMMTSTGRNNGVNFSAYVDININEEEEEEENGHRNRNRKTTRRESLLKSVGIILLTAQSTTTTRTNESSIARASSVAASEPEEEKMIAMSFRPMNVSINDEFKQIEQWPEQPNFLRKRLELALAVALLRSSYDAVDELNVIAMDRFQIQAWKTRQQTFEAYKQLIFPLAMEQGDLNNPLYFDHISYAQYSTLNQILNEGNGRPAIEFEEKLGFDGETKMIKRDERFSTRKQIIPEYAFLCGRNVYNFFKNGFELTDDKPFEGVPDFFVVDSSSSNSSTSTKIKEAVDALMTVFLNYGFCKSFSTSFLEDDNDKKKLIFKVSGPAMLWSIGALENEGARVVNDYVGYCVSYFLYSSGIKSTYTYVRNDEAMVYTFNLNNI
jgi:hypothetical protein